MKKGLLFFVILLWIFFQPLPVEAADLIDTIDFDSISDSLKDTETTEDISFQELVGQLMAQGLSFDFSRLGDYMKELVFGSFYDCKELFLQVIVLALAFSILKSFARSFSNSYITETGFLVLYCLMMVLLLKSFVYLNDMVESTLSTMISFMKAFVPTYCMLLSFPNKAAGSAGFYTMVFGIIFVIEWLILRFLIPLVQIYVLFEFLNHIQQEERFSKLTALLSGTVTFGLKLFTSIILGINIVQGMVASALDQWSGTAVSKTLSVIPGVGNAIGATGQLMLSSGMVIKNCVGAAALIIILMLCIVPVVKMASVALLYKVMAAVVEPVADKRIAGGMNGVAGGGMLYLKIVGTCVMLLFLTIALAGASISI